MDMVTDDPVTQLATAARWAWSSRMDDARRSISRLSREQVLESMRVCADLCRELQLRHSEMAEAELVALEQAMLVEGQS